MIYLKVENLLTGDMPLGSRYNNIKNNNILTV
jgi:hypothetical protein